MTRADYVEFPGFVDLQVNGYGGIDFSAPDLTIDGIVEVSSALAARGTAGFLATMISSPTEVYRRNIPLIADAMALKPCRGRLLGLHLEGPFLSPEPGFCGAHDLRNMRTADTTLFHELCDLARGTLRILTIAADIPGADTLSHSACDLGITVSIGHSAYTGADLDNLVRAGATALTHLGNGIPGMIDRHENPIWSGLAADELTAMLIADGHHLPASVLKTILRAKGAARTVIVSDITPITGLPPGEYEFGGGIVELEPSGRISNPERGCLAGSGVMLIDAMNHLASLRLLDPADLIAVSHTNPLRLIDVESDTIPPGVVVAYDRDKRHFSVVQ
jgi:N-acetylglucosamine-6-phosphate deacetylase